MVLAIGGQPHTITQAACTCTVSPTSASVSPPAGPHDFSGSQLMSLDVLSPVHRIVITRGANGSGAGNVGSRSLATLVRRDGLW